MRTRYRIGWVRTTYFEADIIFEDELDPHILADSHARTGELASRCHGSVEVVSVEEDVYHLKEKEEGYKYRNLPCNYNYSPYSVTGQDDLQQSRGVLEWCYDKKDAETILAEMKKHSQFRDLKIS